MKDLDNAEISLCYAGGSNLITGVLKSGERFLAAENQRDGSIRRFGLPSLALNTGRNVGSF